MQKSIYKLPGVAGPTLILISLIFSSCSLYTVSGSLDNSKTKESSSNGSSQAVNSKAGENVALRCWLFLNEEDFYRTTDGEYKAPYQHFNTDLISPEFDLDPSYIGEKANPNGSFAFLFSPEFVSKGYKTSSAGSSDVTSFNYIELPINADYIYPMGKARFLSIGAGPYIAYGIGGSTKLNFNGQTIKSKVFTSGGYNRFDAGADFGAYYHFSFGLLIGLNYDLGLTNMLPTSGISSKNRSYALSVSYVLNKLIHPAKKEKK